MLADKPSTVVFLDNMCPEYPVTSYKAVYILLPFTTVGLYKMTFSAYFAVTAIKSKYRARMNEYLSKCHTYLANTKFV